MEYVTQFNHLAQYAGSQVDTDDKKKDRFFAVSLLLFRRNCT
jgi:hypothetical protein